MPQRINRGVPAEARQLEHYAEEGPVYFYGGPFSNFVGDPFILMPAYAGVDAFKGPQHFPNVEVYFQSSKACDKHGFFAVCDAYDDTGDTWAAKAAGQNIPLRPDWEEIKYQIMCRGLRAKFTDDQVLVGGQTMKDILLGTGTRFIAEDSPTDFVWGIRDENGGMTGRNLLGLALMQVRAELRRPDAGGYDQVDEVITIAQDEQTVQPQDATAMHHAAKEAL
jgi:ribA/ribD-fused uncharacterized protein